MKHIEVSRKILLGKQADLPALRKALVDRLSRIIDIETLTDEKPGRFALAGTTGTPAGIARHASVSLDVSIDLEDKVARIIISGHARVSRSLAVMYWSAFIVMLLIGLLPGSFETGWTRSGAMDMMVFLLLGGYIVFDMNRKLDEPGDNLDAALQSLETEFG